MKLQSSLHFGRSPCLPIDVLLGRAEGHGTGSRKMSDYTRNVHNTLKVAYDTVRSNVARSKQKQKTNYEKDGVSEEFAVGARVWLFIPAVKTGRTKKLASLWRGPYTVTDRTGHVNYRIQLIGTTKTLIVHRNWLKLCYGEPGVQETHDSLNQAGSTLDELGGPSIEINSQPVNDAMLDAEPIAEVGEADRLEALSLREMRRVNRWNQRGFGVTRMTRISRAMLLRITLRRMRTVTVW